MANDTKQCGDETCDDVVYTTVPKIPPLPKVSREGDEEATNPGDGTGTSSSYHLPNFSMSKLGGLKGKSADWYIVPGDEPGTAKLYNAEGLKHDLENLIELYGTLQSLTHEQADALLELTPAQITKIGKIPKQIVDDVVLPKHNNDNVTVNLKMTDTVTGGHATLPFTINAATPTVGETLGKAGVMSALQATTLAALAAAYESDVQGHVLYEGTASVNTLTLSEEANHFDHLIILGEYMGQGSAAIKQTISVRFYPHNGVSAFQMNAFDVTTGNTPNFTLVQDIWSLSQDNLDLDLVMAQKVNLNSALTVDPETTSNFTITKVIGYGKVA